MIAIQNYRLVLKTKHMVTQQALRASLISMISNTNDTLRLPSTNKVTDGLQIQGKSLAAPYNDAVMAMLPQTPFRPYDTKQQVFPHETINDLPVHPHTRQQIFYPVSESRHFTREDAARAFNEKLLPADKRIPHPELIALEKDNMAGYSREQRYARLRELDAAARKQKEEAAGRKWNLEERTTRVVPGRRWGFRFQDINAEKVGKDGRGRDAVGARYGMPHEDRKKGIVKIPMSVE